MTVAELIAVAQNLGITPEEIETLLASVKCRHCEHRMVLHDSEFYTCNVESCHCQG